MSGKCRNCGSTDIETDPARGDTVCTECGVVFEDSPLVAEYTFLEVPVGHQKLLGHFVPTGSAGGPTSFGGKYHVNAIPSRELTIRNAKKGIAHLCRQLQLNQRCIDTSLNFYKMALSRHLTRGRRQAHNHAACVYITCRTEGTAHMLIDISDVLQICVHELGRTYLRFTQALCINIPSIDPCLYILRFASQLEFGDKTHEVSMTALRVVQRMKRDSIHSGRRPSGLCGAALLIAARLHEFNRSPSDIIKIVKVHESTLRKRLIEFGDTPSSALTLEEFMTVDLEEEQDPPAFKAARKKDRERLQKLENIDTEISELQSEIDRQLEDHSTKKTRKRKEVSNVEDQDAERFIRESNLSVIQRCVERDSSDGDDPDDPRIPDNSTKENNASSGGLGPNMASMGLAAKDHNPANKEKSSFENYSGEVSLIDSDDDELDDYIMSEKEQQIKSTYWRKVNADYLLQEQEKEEKRQQEIEEGKPEKKRRRTTKKNKNQMPASSAGEAIEKMLQEKRISTKINYEVLKSLNVALGTTTQPPKDEPESTMSSSFSTETDSATNYTKTSNLLLSPKPVLSTSTTMKSSTKSRKPTIHNPTVPADATTEKNSQEQTTIDPVDGDVENDDYVDEDDQLEAEQEMTVGQMLGRHATSEDENDNEFGYGYEEEEY